MYKNFEQQEKIEKNTWELLKNLSEEISKKYWIEKQKAINLIKSKSIKSIEDLKKEFESQNKKEKILFEELFLELNNAKEKRQILQNEINWNLEKNLPENLLEKAKNPKNLHEHILWASLWIANSAIIFWKTLTNIWLWILKSPYDLYLVLKWKWEFENFKKI